MSRTDLIPAPVLEEIKNSLLPGPFHLPGAVIAEYPESITFRTQAVHLNLRLHISCCPHHMFSVTFMIKAHIVAGISGGYIADPPAPTLVQKRLKEAQCLKGAVYMPLLGM